jgi:hypothetical protein
MAGLEKPRFPVIRSISLFFIFPEFAGIRPIPRKRGKSPSGKAASPESAVIKNT